MQLLGVIAVPTARVVQHVPLLEPAGPQHSGNGTVGEPLRPREVVVADAIERHRGLAFERDTAPRGIDDAAQSGVGDLQGVEEDAVGPELSHDAGDRLVVVDRLASRADVPRVVVDEYADAALVERVHELPEAGHATVEVELIALVDPDHRIGMPEHHAVEASELMLRLGAEPVRSEAPGVVVVEELVPQPDERDREAVSRPGELGELVGAAVVLDARGRLVAPAAQRPAPRRPLAGIIGGGEDLGTVERAERALERHRRRQIDRPRRPRVACLLDRDRHAAAVTAATARVLSTSSSIVMPSKPGSELVEPPLEGSRPARVDPVEADGGAEDRPDRGTVRVGVPARLDDRADRSREVPVEGVEGGGDGGGVVDRVHPVVMPVALVELVDDRFPLELARKVSRRPQRLGEPAARRNDRESCVGARCRGRRGHRHGVRGGHEHRGVDTVGGMADARVRPRHPRRGHRIAARGPPVGIHTQTCADPFAERVPARPGLRWEVRLE